MVESEKSHLKQTQVLVLLNFTTFFYLSFFWFVAARMNQRTSTIFHALQGEQWLFSGWKESPNLNRGQYMIWHHPPQKTTIHLHQVWSPPTSIFNGSLLEYGGHVTGYWLFGLPRLGVGCWTVHIRHHKQISWNHGQLDMEFVRWN